MATIKIIDVKGWVDKGVPTYSMSVGIEYDWMPLTPDQQDAIKNQAEQLKGIIENQLMTWNGGSPVIQTADKIAKPVVRTVSSIDRATVKTTTGDEPVIMCSECGATCESKIGKNDKPYAYCPNCRDNRTVKGTPFPPRGAK